MQREEKNKPEMKKKDNVAKSINKSSEPLYNFYATNGDERGLPVNNETFRYFAEKLPIGVFLGQEGKLIYVNRKLAEIHGYAVNEIVGKKGTKELVHPEDRRRVERHIRKVVEGKPVPRVISFRGLTNSGEIVYLESHECYFMHAKGGPVLIGTIVDVTERHDIVEQLKRHEEHLQELVDERTSQLNELTKNLRQDIAQREQAEAALETKSRILEEVNTALKVLLRQREDDRRELEEKISSNLKELVLRYVMMLKESRLDPNQRLLTDIIEKNLHDFLSPFSKKITSYDFTPKEAEVVLLTREGKTAKQIARLLSVSADTVNRHKFNIRKKLGLNKNKGNLRSYLSSLS